MKKIELTQRQFALVDDQDFELVKDINWYSNSGYPRNRKVGLLSRFLIKAPTGYEVDHINGNSLDNRRKNLRICLHKNNQKNRKVNKDNTSGYKGVYFASWRNKWRVQITSDNVVITKGYFDSPSEAAVAYKQLAQKYHKEFRRMI